VQHFLQGLPCLRNLTVKNARPIGQLRPQGFEFRQLDSVTLRGRDSALDLFAIG